MSFKVLFSKGVEAFQKAKYENALQYFNEALGCDSEQQKQQERLCYLLYDSRAATYEKLGRLNDALGDVKRAARLAPARWQAYIRGARLLVEMQRFNSAVKMADLGLARLKAQSSDASTTDRENDASVGPHQQRLTELESIKATALRNIHENVPKAVPNKGKGKERARIPESHISALPIELLVEIFSLVIAQDHTAFGRVILRVSRHWRRVACSCPMLWDILVLGSSTGPSRREPRKKARVWLERSRGHIRDLRVRASAIEDPDWRRGLEAELQKLKWKCLRVLSVERWDIDLYLKSKSVGGTLESLEELEIINTNALNVIKMSGKLARLALQGVQVDLKSITTCSLRSLSLNNCQYGSQHVFRFLESHPCLETFTVEETGAALAPPWRYEGFLQMNDLTSIDLSGCLEVPLEKLMVPNLRALRLSGVLSPLERGFQHLATLNLPSFQELSLSQCFCEPKALVTFLESTPTVTVLKLTRNHKTAIGVVEALSSSKIRLLCPRIQHIDVSHCPDIRSAALVRMVKSRLLDGEGEPLATRIETLKMDGCPRVEPGLLPWFREHVPVVSCTYLSRKAAAGRR
ncbi:hypothetical protein AX17_006308 [Amanita inopinata Kibby_2008]|nr:hypothetical protein AX17_006308 [Amanita inopinata Kibby_2008]